MNKHNFKKVTYYSDDRKCDCDAYIIGEIDNLSDYFFAFDPGIKGEGGCGALIILEKVNETYSLSGDYNDFYSNDSNGKMKNAFDLPPVDRKSEKEKEAVMFLKKLGYQVKKK